MDAQDNMTHPSDPAHARSWTRSYLTEFLPPGGYRDDLVDDALLVVSELVTNAINAGSARHVLTVEVADSAVLIAVADDAQGVPVVQHAEREDTHGRGLMIVSALARDWGVDVSTAGKIVWARLSLA